MSGGQRSKDGFQTYKVVVVVSVLEAQQQIPKLTDMTWYWNPQSQAQWQRASRTVTCTPPHPKPFRHDKLLVVPHVKLSGRGSAGLSPAQQWVWTWNPEPFWGLGVPDRLYITEPSLLPLEYWLLFWSCCNLIDQSLGQSPNLAVFSVSLIFEWVAWQPFCFMYLFRFFLIPWHKPPALIVLHYLA